MGETKYPVVVRIDGQTSYKWLTLSQANERFVVVGNRLVANNVEPLSLEYCQFLLDQAQKSLKDCQAEFEDICSDMAQYQVTNERLVLEYLQPKLEKAKEAISRHTLEIDFLTKALAFLNT